MTTTPWPTEGIVDQLNNYGWTDNDVTPPKELLIAAGEVIAALREEMEKRADYFILSNRVASQRNELARLNASYNAANMVANNHANRSFAFARKIAILTTALRECAAEFISPPGTVEQCQQAVAVEFQRRLNVAGNALVAVLSDEQATTPDLERGQV